MNDQEIYKAKQEWLEKVMESEMSHANKTWAFCIFRRMYGVALTSWPGTEQIMEDGHFTSSGHFQQYRRLLVECGALVADLGYHSSGAMAKNYKYTLNLSWDGAIAPQVQSRSTSGGSHSTSGASNTTTNTTSKTTNNHSTAVADAPTVKSSPNYKLEEAGVDIESSPNSNSKQAALPKDHIEAIAPVVLQHDYSFRTAADWRLIKTKRSLTQDEKDYINKTATEYNRKMREAKEPVLIGGDW